jgi:FkbM family methyltransferase
VVAGRPLLYTNSMKSRLKASVQRLLGFDNYLLLHGLFAFVTMRFRPSEGAVRHFVERLPKHATILDIGANEGHMSLLFARRAKLGKVIAFEPIPENFKAAQRLFRLARVRNVWLYALGLGECDSTLEMFMPTDASGGRLGGVSYVVDPNHRPTAAGVSYAVPIRRLDTWPELKETVHAIKIDVEDHERYVFRGAKAVIERDRPLIYAELFSPENKDECFAFLMALGYRAFVSVGADLVAYDPARHGHVNFLFLPPDSVAEPGGAIAGPAASYAAR